jgi:SAM-dependent methyltransferase
LPEIAHDSPRWQICRLTESWKLAADSRRESPPTLADESNRLNRPITRLMDRAYWDHIAGDYDDRVLNSLASDRCGVIRRTIERLADRQHAAADFGCGTGHYLPLLADRCAKVYGIDHSQRLLDVAAERCGDLPNVDLRRADLAGDGPRMRPVRLAVCINVLISPQRGAGESMLANIARRVARGGRLVLVVPSLESALYVNRRYVDWNVKRGVPLAAARRAGLPVDSRLLAGVVELDGAATRHYLAQELHWLLDDAGFDVERLERVEYDWTTEFQHPPDWLAGPYPWDWLAVARRRQRYRRSAA